MQKADAIIGLFVYVQAVIKSDLSLQGREVEMLMKEEEEGKS